METRGDAKKRKIDGISTSFYAVYYDNDLDNLLTRFNEHEKTDIMNIVNEYPTARDGFRKLLEVFLQSSLLIKSEKPVLSIAGNNQTVCKISSLRFLSPRKKCDFEIHQQTIQIRSADTIHQEHYIEAISRIFYLPVNQTTWNVVIMFHNKPKDSVIFSIGEEIHYELTEIQSESISNGTKRPKIVELLQDFIHIPVVEASLDIFSSTDKQPFVPCVQKAKEGNLYILRDGFLFGMKKPIQYIPLNQVADIIFTTITSRNFELQIVLADKTEFTYSLIDCKEFQVVSDYIDTIRPQMAENSDSVGPLKKGIRERELPPVIERVPLNGRRG